MREKSIQTMVDRVVNFGKVTVYGLYTNLDTVILLNTNDGLRLPDPEYNLTWWNSTDYKDPSDDPYREIVRVMSKAGDTITVTRHQEGTTATDKNIAGKTYKMILAVTAKIIPDLQTDAQTRADTTVETHRLTGIHALPQPSQTVPNRSSFTAQVINAPTAGTLLPNIPIPDSFALILRSSIGNTGQIFVANSVTNATSSAIPGNRITLNAGDVIKLYITNANLMAIAGSATGNNVDILVEQ